MCGRAVRGGRPVRAERIAVIDIGTVTTRMLVADVRGHAIAEVARRSVITQLGEGWTMTGRLSEAAITRVAEAVRGFHVEAEALGVARVSAIATSAARDAGNSDALLERLSEVGVTPEVVSGEREALLTFAGATHSVTGDGLLVVDVGGGSTEIVIGSATPDARGVTIDAACSFDVGSRRVTERFLRTDPPTRHEIDEATAWAEDLIRAFFSERAVRPREMIATSGVATSLAAIEQALDPYDASRVQGFRLYESAIARMLGQLASLPLHERRRVPGLEPERAGVIVGGVLVLAAVLRMSGLASTLTSEHDILYGMVLDAFGATTGAA